MTPCTVLPSLYPVVKVNNYYRALDPGITSRDNRVVKTITTTIAAFRDEGHRGLLEQDFIGNHLHGTDVIEFIRAHYDPLVKFQQDGTCRDDFVVTIDNKVLVSWIMPLNWFCPDPLGVSPSDLITLDSDSVVFMRLSLNRWVFPCPVRHLQIYHKYT